MEDFLLKLRFWKRAPSLDFHKNFPDPERPRGKLSGKLYDVVGAIVSIIASIFGIEAGTIIGVGVGGLVYGLSLTTMVTVGLASIVAGLSIWSMTQGGKKTGGGGAGSTFVKNVDQNGNLINTKLASEVIRVVYGIYKVGGNWIFNGGDS